MTANDGAVTVGLQQLDYDLSSAAYSYVSPLWEKKEDQMSVLKILDMEFGIQYLLSNSASGTQASSSAAPVYGPSPPPESLPEVQSSEIFL